jgi:phosphatidate cytidylyltransferase
LPNFAAAIVATAPHLANPDPSARARALRLRIISSLVLLPLVLAAVWYGYPAFDLVIAAASVIMAREWARLTTRGSRQMIATLTMATAVLVLVAMTIAGVDVGIIAASAALFAVLLYLAARLWGIEAADLFAIGVLAIGLPCVAFEWLRADPSHGRATVYWILAVVIATDTGAFMVGRSVGGPKLAPRISPNKTWSGLFGGVVSAALAGALTAPLLGQAGAQTAALVSAALAVVAQGGDLGESVLKRHFGVKDTGGLIPGHGGLLDRVDGLLAVVPMVAAITWLSRSSVLDWR